MHATLHHTLLEKQLAKSSWKRKHMPCANEGCNIFWLKDFLSCVHVHMCFCMCIYVLTDLPGIFCRTFRTISSRKKNPFEILEWKWSIIPYYTVCWNHRSFSIVKVYISGYLIFNWITDPEATPEDIPGNTWSTISSLSSRVLKGNSVSHNVI